MNKKLFTSESVTSGHPDKICDLIADSILDEALKNDPLAKMAVECTIKDDLILIYGEATINGEINYEKIALDTIKEIGYNEKYNVVVKVSQQSCEICNSVYKNDNELGAGDQGIMFGYATDETPELMPKSILLAHKLANQLEKYRKENPEKGLMPDGKTQVTIEYDENDNLIGINTILISTQHKEGMTNKEIYDVVYDKVILKVIPKEELENTKIIINPSGSFVMGGSFGDSGTTGRKIVVDTYGGHGRIGGGCFSSKDPTKVDRSAAYYSRYVAKNIVVNNLARKCEIQVSYGIGSVKPISINVNCFGTNKIPMNEIHKIINENFDFSLANIIKELDLRRPIYKKTACYGHFGRNEFSWEKIKKF
jgi:S-adenosylmethionine synthetase